MATEQFHADLPEGVTINVPSPRFYRDAFLNSIPWVDVTITIISTAGSLASIAAFIWSKFAEGKKPVQKVTVNRRVEVKWTQEEFTCVLQEELTKETEQHRE